MVKIIICYQLLLRNDIPISYSVTMTFVVIHTVPPHRGLPCTGCGFLHTILWLTFQEDSSHEVSDSSWNKQSGLAFPKYNRIFFTRSHHDKSL